MRPRDLFGLILSNLKRMRLRLALTSLGVVIGTSSIVLMVSLGIGLQVNMERELGDIGAATHIDVFGGFSPGGQEIQPLDARALAEIEAIEGVETVMEQASIHTLGPVKYKRTDVFLSAVGAPMDSLEQMGYQVEFGRLPRNEKEVLLGAQVPRTIADSVGFQMDSAEDMVGERLDAIFYEPSEPADSANEGEGLGTAEPPAEIRRRLTVVGILASQGGMTQADNAAFFTLDAALEFNGVSPHRAEYSNVTVEADSIASVEKVERELTDLGYSAFSARAAQEAMRPIFMTIQGVLGALGAISMFVAALGIANTMLMSIYERTREIGIMKAVGASGRQIKRVFLGEAAAIGLLGGAVGLIFSLAAGAVGNLFVRGLIAAQPTAGASDAAAQVSFFITPLWLAVFAMVFAAGVGLLAGLLPAIRAANLDPLIALRHE